MDKVKVLSVEPYAGPVDEGFVEVFDITVEPTHLYCAAGVVVSNSKRLALLDVNALMSHGAVATLRDAAAYRGQQDDRLWLQFMQGFTPSEPKVPMVYKKFVNQLKAAGINVVRDGYQTHVMAMTAPDVDQLAGDREITSGETVNFDKALAPIKGGLFDEQLTGGHGGRRWSFARLPEPYPSPVMEEPIRRVLGLTQKKFEGVISGDETLGGFGTGPSAVHKALDGLNLDKEINTARMQFHSGRATARDAAVRKWGYLQDAKRLGLHPRDWVLPKVPVLPPVFRPVSFMSDSKIPLVADANYMYKELFHAVRNHDETVKELGEKNAGPERLALYNAFKAVTGLGDPIHPKLVEKNVKGVLKSVFGSAPKFGVIQRKLLASTVDNVGRAVVVPNPDYDMDTVGIPDGQAFQVYSRFIVRRLRRRGLPVREALRHVLDKTDLARDMLVEEMEQRPVYINRAPVLHKFGIMAFKPKLVKGNVLQVSPVILKGFNMDFDGDQQICTVLVFLDDGLYSEADIARMFPGGSAVATRFRARVHGVSGRECFLVNLEDFPHIERDASSEPAGVSRVVYQAAPGMQVLAYDEARGRPVLAGVSHWSRHAGREVVTVELQSGRQILTDDDPRAVYGYDPATESFCRRRPAEAMGLFAPRVERLPTVRRAERIRELPVPSGRPERLVDSVSLDRAFGWFLGAMAGNGWVTGVEGAPEQVCLATVNSGIEAEYRAQLARLFRSSPTIGVRTRTEDESALFGNSRVLVCSSVEAATFLVPLIGHGARNKHLPRFYLFGTRSFRLGLVAGLLDADGAVSVSHGKSKPQLMVSYSSSSLRLVQETQHLLRSVGIQSRVTSSRTPRGDPFWVLNVSTVDFCSVDVRLQHTGKRDILGTAPAPNLEIGTARGGDPIPLSKRLSALLLSFMPKDVREGGFGSVYSVVSMAKKTGSVSRSAATKLVSLVGDRLVDSAWDTFRKMAMATKIRWDRVESFTPTGIIETGYDLTVPGYETFMSADGVILSNTSQFHVPTTDEAVKEAYERMLPSSNLISPADFQTPMHTPIQEYSAGLYHASTAKSKKKPTRVFRTRKDALAAQARGEITVDTPVHVADE